MKIKFISILLITVSIFSKNVDELAEAISNSNMKIKYYFWVEENKAFLSTINSDKTYKIWHFTKDRKWQPIHNAPAFDGFNKANIVFSKVALDITNGKITISKIVDKSLKGDILALAQTIENKTMNIGWYFWNIKEESFLLSDNKMTGVRIWNFTNSRKWQPIHNAPAFDGFPLAGEKLEDVSFNPNIGSIRTGNMIHSSFGGSSNIMYLKDNHKNYSNDNSQTPAPIKDKSTKSIKWSINGKTKENATKLASHIKFMLTNLKEGRIPRKRDKLFVMESYMKVNHKYTTNIETIDKKVSISKIATTLCAYEVISAHSNAVSGDFFGQGILTNDYSSIAEEILASSSCDNERSSIELYISNNMYGGFKGKGHRR